MKSMLRSLGQRYLQSVRKYYFFPGHAQSINLFRFLFCGAIFAQLVSDAPYNDHTLATGAYNSLQVLDWFGIGLMSADQLVACRIALLTALGCAAIGLFSRTALTVSWVLFVLYAATMLGFTKSAHSNYVNHSKNIVVVVLWILSAAPAIGMWGVDGLRKRGWRWKLPDPSQAIVSAWATQLVKLALCLAYFGSGYCKFIKGGILWADGYTLQAYLLNKHLLLETPAGLWLSQHYWLCVLLGAGTLVIELTFFLIIFFPRLTWFYVAGGLTLHKSIEWIMKINFLPYFGYVYFIFLDWPTVLKLASAARGCWNRVRLLFGSAALPARAIASQIALDRNQVVGETKFARSFVIGMAALLLGCIIFRVERWPFTDYRVYADRHHYEKISVYRLASIGHDGQLEWLDRAEMTGSGTTLNRRFRHATRYDDGTAFKEILEHEAQGISEDGRQKIRAVAVVRRTVEKGSDGRLQIKNETVLAKSLEEAPASEPRVLQAWFEDTSPATVRR
jgi:hypothetical protein